MVSFLYQVWSTVVCAACSMGGRGGLGWGAQVWPSLADLSLCYHLDYLEGKEWHNP